MSAVLITGCSGYIGQNLVRALSTMQQVERIIGVDLVPYPHAQPQFSFLQAAFGDLSAAYLRGERIRTIVHCAYPLRPGGGYLQALQDNFIATRKLIDAAAQAEIAHFFYLSSATVYGFRRHGDERPFTESSSLDRGTSLLYARYKILTEQLLQEALQDSRFVCVTSVRPSFIVGGGSRTPLFEYLDRSFFFLPSRLSPLQLTHIDDLTAAIAGLMQNKCSGTFNVGAPGGLTVRDMLRRLHARWITIPNSLLHAANALAWKVPVRNFSPGPSTVLALFENFWQADSTLLRETLGFQFRYSSSRAFDSFARECLESRFQARFPGAPPAM